MKDWPTYDYEGGNPMLHTNTDEALIASLKVRIATMGVTGSVTIRVADLDTLIRVAEGRPPRGAGIA